MNSKEIAEILTFESLDLDWFNDAEELEGSIAYATEEIEKIKGTPLWYLLENLAYKFEGITETDFYKHVKKTIAELKEVTL